MSFTVSDFRAQMQYDGARPNLFQITLVMPTYALNSSAAGSKATFMAKAAQIPGSSLNNIPMYYFGRELKFAGNRTFADWTLQIINDEDFLIRNALESWSNAINGHASNLRAAAALNMSGYTVDAIVTQFGKTGNIIATYNMIGAWPVDIAPIDLDWGTNDTIEEYPVTFAFQWWENAVTTS